MTATIFELVKVISGRSIGEVRASEIGECTKDGALAIHMLRVYVRKDVAVPPTHGGPR